MIKIDYKGILVQIGTAALLGSIAFGFIYGKHIEDHKRAELKRNEENAHRIEEIIDKEEFIFNAERHKLLRNLQLDSINTTNYIQQMQDIEKEHEEKMQQYDKLKTDYAPGEK